LSEAGAVTAPGAGAPLVVRGNTAWLRVAPVTITPPDAADWSIGGATYQGAQTLMLPAGAALTLRRDGAGDQALTLDATCHPAAAAGPFKAALAQGADLARSCN
jgi:hypothetical protein